MTQEKISAEKHEKILGQVRGLLATADHPNTPPEMAETYRAKAEAMMFKYRIEEATMVANGIFGDSEGGLKPIWRTLGLANVGSEFSNYYERLGGMVIHHTGCKAVMKREGEHFILDAVGYATDLMYAEVLLTACLLEFSKRLEPTYDRNLSDAANAYEMRMAGMERKRIAKILFGDWETENEMKAKNRKVTALIKQEAARRGEDASVVLGRGNNMRTWRESYADGFVNQMSARLYRMRTAHGEESGAMVLADRGERVNEALYEKYPRLRPPDPSTLKEYKAPNADCEKCRNAKSGYCREHSWLKPSRGRVTYRSQNGRAYDRGTTAALNVDLGPNATGTGRVSGGSRPVRGEI